MSSTKWLCKKDYARPGECKECYIAILKATFPDSEYNVGEAR